MATAKSTLLLEVPVNASKVEKRDPERMLKLAAIDASGKVLASTLVKFDAEGQGLGRLELASPEGAVRVLLAPPDVDDADLPGLQTLSINVPRKWAIGKPLRLAPMLVSNYYWLRWLNWCRNFVVHGRVVCPDGLPVPGAQVTAFDVDAFWWWTGYQLLGASTTDANGEFSLRFKWCCGLWPWWWWRLRHWSLDPDLVARLREHVRLQPDLPAPPRPTPTPDPRLLEDWLHIGPGSGPGPGPRAPALSARLRPEAALTLPYVGDPRQLNQVRDQLMLRLPRPKDVELSRVWPWVTFEPWNDCHPDLVFRVVQSCGGIQHTIVNETRLQARWNVATTTEVTLVANADACCAEDIPPIDDDCATPLGVCGYLANAIGGNLGAAAAPQGYADPGGGDAPFGGVITLTGDVGADYYAFEATTTPANSASWVPLGSLSTGGFTRVYWDVPSTSFVPVGFSFEMLDGRWVIQSRRHYESTHFPGDWGFTHNHIWLSSELMTLLHWQTEGNHADGLWSLRLMGFKRVGDTLQPLGVMPVCSDQQPRPDAQLVLALDNTVPGATPSEPDADVVALHVNNVALGPCGKVKLGERDVLDIDFIAHDPDGHLHSFSLVATYGKDMPAIDLLSAAGALLTPQAQGSVFPADHVGPSYAMAKLQGASAPIWRGGGLRLHLPDLTQVFPVSCAYQIELRVYSRTIVNCNGNLPQRDFSYYSVTVEL